MRKFYVIHTKPKQEYKAVSNLERQGYRLWTPFVQKELVKNDKIVTKNELFFPGYIFVILDLLRDDWVKIQSTFGVKYLITNNGLPKAIEYSTIRLIKKLIKGHSLNINDNVKILSGKLANKKGYITDLCTKDRVRLLLESLSGKITVVLSRKVLQKI